MQSRNLSKYGWKKDLPDHRDLQYKVPKTKALIPTSYDLRKSFNLPACYDQGDLGSCTGNGCGFCWQFALQKETLPAPTPARLFIYYYERVIEGTVNQDSGAQIRDGLRVLNQNGCCDETLWPYDISKFKKIPSPKAIAAAASHKATKYLSVKQDEITIKTCLASGTPIVFGFVVYESFETETVANTGVVPMPKRSEQQLGGHCVCLVGYDDKKKVFICRNSWGTGWAQAGYFTMPYAYILNNQLSSDFWAVQTVS